MNIFQATAVARSTGFYRWRICALLFFATTLNYVDRQVIGILAPQLQAELGWSDAHYGLIVTAFQVAYALGFLFMGTLFDKIGSRLGYLLSITVWSLATMAHALARTAIGFGIARFVVRRAIFPALSRLRRSGFHYRNGRLPRAFFCRAAAWAPSSHPGSCPSSPYILGGTWLSCCRAC